MAQEVYEKMVKEALAAQKADLGVIREKRGKEFKVTDAKPYVDAVNGMTVGKGQSKEVIDLHVKSVNAHYKILTGLTDYVRPEDDPFVEHYQTPPILEILYAEDPAFRKSMEKFIAAIEANEAFIGKESIRRYGGFYGPTCVVDFAFVPGSTSNVVNRILRGLDIPVDHKKAILSSKSWGMNTSYGVGAAFQEAIEAGKTPDEAIKAEIAMLKLVYDQPTVAQAQLMDTHNLGGHGPHTSFDVRKYMAQYKEAMVDPVKAAIKAGVHYANIVTVPAYCVGDVAHHIAQSMYNMAKDDVTWGIMEAEAGVLEKTLNRGLAQGFKSEYQVLSVATGATAVGAAYILYLDGVTAPMVIDFLTKRYDNYVQQYPNRGPAAELHNVDFMDVIWRGWQALRDCERQKNGGTGKGPVVGGVEVDLSPIDEHEVLSNPQRYTYPACAITVRFSSMMRLADFPCLLTSEPVTATLMTNIIALHPETPGSPARVCKDCAVTNLNTRWRFCEWKVAV